jgi:parallel beta-helix repeat protein
MTYTFKLSRRLAVSRYWGMFALLALTFACSERDPLTGTDGEIFLPEREVQVEVFPQSVYAEVNQLIQLNARGRLASRELSPIAVEWSASGGTISSDGLFSAKEPGTYKVVGKRRGRNKGDTTTVVVDSSAKVVALVLSPDTSSLHPAESRQFTTKGTLSDGSSTDVGTVWKAEGGSIDAAGNYVAGSNPGHYRVIATNVAGTLGDTAEVDVLADGPTLTTLELTPATVTLTIGSTQQFNVQERLTDGSSSAVQARYTASGGTITSAGLFSAGPTTGTYQVIATTEDGLADTSAVTINAPLTGTEIYPGTDIQAAVDANPPGTSFVLKAGVHRLQQVRPKDGNTFAGEAGAILSGARLLNSFTRSGGYWVVSGQTQQGKATGMCQFGYEACSYPEDLFVDDRLLRHVTSLAEVTPDTWYFDYTMDKIYIAIDPTGRKVETSVSADAFSGPARGVTLRNLAIEKYANSAQHGAVHGHDGVGWKVEGNEIRWNHGTGMRVGDGMRAVNNGIHHNGQLGIGGRGRDVLVEGNEIAYNNTVGYKVGFEAGGSKFVKTDGLVVRRNYVHHNAGNGLWTDIDNIRTLIEENRVIDNTYQGIFHEISYEAVIRNNTVEGNGFGHKTWLFGSGILVAASPNVEVYGNVVRDNYNGITAVQQNRGSGAYGAHEISNLSVHDNIVTMRGGKTGLAQDIGDPSYFTSRNNRWVNNTYYLGPETKYFAWQGMALSESEWRGYGQDVQGRFLR